MSIVDIVTDKTFWVTLLLALSFTFGCIQITLYFVRRDIKKYNGRN